VCADHRRRVALLRRPRTPPPSCRAEAEGPLLFACCFGGLSRGGRPLLQIGEFNHFVSSGFTGATREVRVSTEILARRADGGLVDDFGPRISWSSCSFLSSCRLRQAYAFAVCMLSEMLHRSDRATSTAPLQFSGRRSCGQSAATGIGSHPEPDGRWCHTAAAELVRAWCRAGTAVVRRMSGQGSGGGIGKLAGAACAGVGSLSYGLWARSCRRQISQCRSAYKMLAEMPTEI
jgi:hypothetical protein